MNTPPGVTFVPVQVPPPGVGVSEKGMGWSQSVTSGPALTTGKGFTVMVTVADPEQVPSDPITVYVCVVVGFAVTVAVFVAERPVDGLQV